MALIIYGSAMSRAYRVIWMAKELGIPYEQVSLDVRKGETRTPEYLKINPNGHIPAIRDGDLILWESMAINLYLAKKHGGPLAPSSPAEEARAIMWSFWAISELEDPTVTLVQQSFGMPIEAARVDRAKDLLKQPLGVLDAALAASPFLLGSRFTVADLNVASVVTGLALAKYDLSPWPKLTAWLSGCTARRAFAEARGAPPA